MHLLCSEKSSFCGSNLLSGRIHLAVGANSISMDTKRLFKQIKLHVDKEVSSFLVEEEKKQVIGRHIKKIDDGKKKYSLKKKHSLLFQKEHEDVKIGVTY